MLKLDSDEKCYKFGAPKIIFLKMFKKSGISIIYLTTNLFSVLLPGTLNWFCALFRPVSLLQTFDHILFIPYLTVLCWFQFKLSKFSPRHTLTTTKNALKYARHHLSQLLLLFHCFFWGYQINCTSHPDIFGAVHTHKLY